MASNPRQSNSSPSYMSGFGNEFASEAIPGALPVGRNSPQRCPFGLYAEQLSGTAFTAPRGENFRTWMYRMRPSAVHGSFRPLPHPTWMTAPFALGTPDPNQMRWDPAPMPGAGSDFIDGLFTMVGNGDAATRGGLGVHLYACNADMKRFAYDADGELLIVPQQGTLEIRTELGRLEVGPLEIAVIPKGMKFQILLLDTDARGYVCENYGSRFELPGLGPIGANGLANPRDFLSPDAWYEDRSGAFDLVVKYQGGLWVAPIDRSPLDVVAWHGNYAPYKYDLRRFNAVNSVTFDHCDPSIFTVLTSPSGIPGTANCDFVIFPPRWQVSEDTFRPPWFHRNVMSEYMGLIHGIYDGKSGGFLPGGSSLHNCFAPHGPDAATFEKASAAPSEPSFLEGSLAFMFESGLAFQPSSGALDAPFRQRDYQSVWQGLTVNFDPEDN